MRSTDLIRFAAWFADGCVPKELVASFADDLAHPEREGERERETEWKEGGIQTFEATQVRTSEMHSMGKAIGTRSVTPGPNLRLFEGR